MTALVDLVHSLGTARVASIFAPILVLINAIYSGIFVSGGSPYLHVPLAVVVVVGMFYAFNDGYHRTSRVAQAMADEVLSDALIAEKIKNNDKPIETWPRLPDL
jgi:hypothetical protein